MHYENNDNDILVVERVRTFNGAVYSQPKKRLLSIVTNDWMDANAWMPLISSTHVIYRWNVLQNEAKHVFQTRISMAHFKHFTL